MSRRALSLLSVCAVLVVGCSTPHIDIEPRFSPSQIDGSVAFGSGASATAVSIDQLGLDNDGSEVGGRIDVKWGSPHFSASYAPNSFQGDSVLSAPITSGGTTIPSGAAVQSDLKMNVTSAVLTFDLLPIPDFEAGLGLGVAVVDFDTQIQETLTGSKVDTSATIPVPLLAGRLTWNIWRFQASVLASGMTYSNGSQSMDYYDVDAEMRFNFIGHESRVQGWISAGYRQIGADFAYDESGAHVKSDLTLKGPFLGLVLGF